MTLDPASDLSLFISQYKLHGGLYKDQASRIEHRVDTRCGICDQEIPQGAKTVRVDGERCHKACAEDQ